MAYILSYLKKSDEYTVYQLNLPEGAQELCELDGVTYVAVPDDATMPDEQPVQLSDPDPVTLTTGIRDNISDACPQVHLIRQRVKSRIAERYSIEDEIKLLRIGSGEKFDAYYAFTESCRAWGREQKAELGL